MTNFTPASTIHLRVAPDTPIKNPEPQEPLTPEPEEAPAPATATATAPKEAPAKAPPNSKSRSLSVMMVPRLIEGKVILPSFAWHGVKDGDIIEIFDGVVDNNCLGHRCV
ncbi:unnamed protein product [Vicia faba]|uniref:Uncharacterized protein n=1 Tax=Vicia faba TaxID=3906 RepID=A0AAV0YCZ7_VICFA|nr:unnamed protein product [Vicia faba]